MNYPVAIGLVVGGIGLLLFLIHRYLTRNYGYWEAQGVPTIPPRLFYGSTYDAFKISPTKLENDRYEKYGRVYGTYEFFSRTLNIADPELAHQVLVKDFHLFTNRRAIKTNIPVMDAALSSARDETWKRIRTVVSPSFTSGKMRKMNPHFVDAAQGLISNFMDAADSSDSVNVKKFFSAYSMDVFGLCGLGIRVDSLKNPEHPFVVNSRKLFARDLSVFFILTFVASSFSRLFGKMMLNKMGFTYFIGVCDEIIRKRKEMTDAPTQVDFVQLMLNAREGKDDAEEKEETHLLHVYQENENSTPRPAWNITKTLSDVEILSQTTQFFSVGHETVSTALAFATYELASHPEMQERLFEEVKQAYEIHGEMSYDVVSKMAYLEAVVFETLRLHTVALKAEREASEDYTVGTTGIVVPKGGLVMILLHAIHHDPEWFPEPNKFDPERFLPENQSLLTPYTFLPFGDGPRNCIAMRFALLEIKLCLAMVIRKIKFVATEETKRPVELYISGGTLLIPKEIKMNVEKRSE